jgi:hypothetical protein
VKLSSEGWEASSSLFTSIFLHSLYTTLCLYLEITVYKEDESHINSFHRGKNLFLPSARLLVGMVLSILYWQPHQVKTTTTCLATSKCLLELQSKYKGAPMVVASICTESTTLVASLSFIQSLLLQRQDLASVWQSRTDLPMVLDAALTGAMVLFSCLHSEIQSILAGAPDSSQLRWRSRVRVMWNEAKLNELLNALRGQQISLNLLIQLLQMYENAHFRQ